MESINQSNDFQASPYCSKLRIKVFYRYLFWDTLYISLSLQQILTILVSKSKLGYLWFKIETEFENQMKDFCSIVDQTPIFLGHPVLRIDPRGTDDWPIILAN